MRSIGPREFYRGGRLSWIGSAPSEQSVVPRAFWRSVWSRIGRSRLSTIPSPDPRECPIALCLTAKRPTTQCIRSRMTSLTPMVGSLSRQRSRGAGALHWGLTCYSSELRDPDVPKFGLHDHIAVNLEADRRGAGKLGIGVLRRLHAVDPAGERVALGLNSKRVPLAFRL